MSTASAHPKPREHSGWKYPQRPAALPNLLKAYPKTGSLAPCGRLRRAQGPKLRGSRIGSKHRPAVTSTSKRPASSGAGFLLCEWRQRMDSNQRISRMVRLSVAKHRYTLITSTLARKSSWNGLLASTPFCATLCRAPARGWGITQASA